MEDLPYKHGFSPAEIDERIRIEREQEAKKKAASDKRRATRAANAKKLSSARHRSTATTRSQTAKTVARPVKKLPPMRLPGEEQPRDRFGRFARKTGAVLKGALFGTARVVGGTVAAAHHGYKTVKRIKRKGRANQGKVGIVKRRKVRRRKR